LRGLATIRGEKCGLDGDEADGDTEDVRGVVVVALVSAECGRVPSDGVMVVLLVKTTDTELWPGGVLVGVVARLVEIVAGSA
jgi:hypothetical protein